MDDDVAVKKLDLQCRIYLLQHRIIFYGPEIYVGLRCIFDGDSEYYPGTQTLFLNVDGVYQSVYLSTQYPYPPQPKTVS